MRLETRKDCMYCWLFGSGNKQKKLYGHIMPYFDSRFLALQGAISNGLTNLVNIKLVLYQLNILKRLLIEIMSCIVHKAAPSILLGHGIVV